MAKLSIKINPLRIGIKSAGGRLGQPAGRHSPILKPFVTFVVDQAGFAGSLTGVPSGSNGRLATRRPGVDDFLQDYWPELMIAIGAFASCLALLLPWA
jgi:hypothetical protein